MSRHLDALRNRLDWLVRLEDERGDEQRGVHHNRAERNALIFALSEFAERAGLEAAREPQPRKPHSHDYIQKIDEQIDDAIAMGFIKTRDRKPGVLYHQREDAAPVEVPLNVWFAVRYYARGHEDL